MCKLTHLLLPDAVLTGTCNGLCDAETTIAKLHADANCTAVLPTELPMMEPMYDFSPVGCIQLDDNGNVNKSLCNT